MYPPYFSLLRDWQGLQFNILPLFIIVHCAVADRADAVVPLIVYARTVTPIKRWCGRMMRRVKRWGRLKLGKMDRLRE
jgi:hypothetical protein